MNYELKTLKRGDVVTGTILSVKEKEILIDIQYSSEGTMYLNAYGENIDSFKDVVKVGDQITAVVNSVSERDDWVEACKLARLLYENRSDELYEGYKDTDVFKDGELDLV